MIQLLRQRVKELLPDDDADADGTRTVWLAVAALAMVFGLTATWTLPYHIDPLTNAITGWYVGTQGTVIADGHDAMADDEQHGHIAWFVDSPRGTVSQYPPAAALAAGAVYAIAQPGATETTMLGVNNPDAEPITVPMPPVWPATVSAVLVTAVACAAVAVVTRHLGASTREAVVAGGVTGLATGAWSVASDASWTHGPTVVCIALALLAAARDRWWLTGLALGVGILARPHVAVIAAVVGLWVSVSRRLWGPVVKVGLGSLVGLAALLAYNYWVWDVITLTGGYGGDFVGRIVEDRGWGWFAANVVGGLVDVQHGVLVWAPFLVVLGIGAWKARDHVPDWASAGAVGGVLYLLVQWRLNRSSGGAGFFGYRYPLAAMFAAAPMLYVGYDRWVKGNPRAMGLWRLTVVFSIAGQAAGAVVA